jgi:hypothetical protein
MLIWRAVWLACAYRQHARRDASTLSLAICRLPLRVMNQLSIVRTQAFKMYNNGITVEAGEANLAWLLPVSYLLENPASKS